MIWDQPDVVGTAITYSYYRAPCPTYRAADVYVVPRKTCAEQFYQNAARRATSLAGA